MTFAMIGLLVNGALTFTLLPPRPKGRSRWIYVSILLQWLFLPLSTILFGAVPALDAQTRMLFKRYLGFFYTEKFRRGTLGTRSRKEKFFSRRTNHKNARLPPK